MASSVLQEHNILRLCSQSLRIEATNLIINEDFSSRSIRIFLVIDYQLGCELSINLLRGSCLFHEFDGFYHSISLEFLYVLHHDWDLLLHRWFIFYLHLIFLFYDNHFFVCLLVGAFYFFFYVLYPSLR